MKALSLLLVGLAAIAQPALHIELPYSTVSGATLTLDLAVPAPSSSPAPLLICLHGGGWSMGSKGSFRKYLPQFAALGHAAAAIQYRLAPAHTFPAPLDDVRAAIAYLRANAARFHIDPNKITLLGASAGAHLALLAGWQLRDEIRAVIDISGPTDLRDWQMSPPAEAALIKTTNKRSRQLVDELMGGRPPADASPVLQLGPGAKPTLIFQYREDQAVAADQVTRLEALLKQHRIPHETVWFDGRGHALAGPGTDQLVPRTVAFLNALP